MTDPAGLQLLPIYIYVRLGLLQNELKLKAHGLLLALMQFCLAGATLTQLKSNVAPPQRDTLSMYPFESGYTI